MSHSIFTGESTEAVTRQVAEVLTPNYNPIPLVLTEGQGMWVVDRDGNRYLDMIGGIAVNSLGHAHPRLLKAINEQAAKLIHISNLFINEPALALAAKLNDISGFDRVYFSNSGAEANESAFKCARRYQTIIRGDTHKTGVLSFEKSFHGRTLGALSLTGQPKYHEGFEPLIPGIRYARFGDLASVDACLEADPTIGAIIVEPIQCEGGITLPPPGFFEGLRQRADKHGLILIFDEVQTGLARTGHWWAFEYLGVRPDILTTAKGIAGGIPLSAMMTTAELSKGLQPGTHQSTFGANPLATRVGLEVLSTIEDDALIANARDQGTRLQQGLQALKAKYPEHIQDVRGLGLIQGAEMSSKELAAETVKKARDNGLLVNVVQGQTLRFVPPLIISADDVDEALNRLEASF